MAAVIVDDRADEAMRFVLEQTARCLSPTWTLYWFHTRRNRTEQVVSQLPDETRARLVLRRLPHTCLNVKRYNALCLSTWFWEQIPQEDVFVFQRDGCPSVLSPHTLEEFVSLALRDTPPLPTRTSRHCC